MEALNKPKGKLFLVATPIGNLEDLSPRALRYLSEADIIAAEDTRQTLKLLNHFQLRKRMISYREQNHQHIVAKLIQYLDEGKNIALVSDAGMPLISDPGEELVKAVYAADLSVSIIPGPSAGLSALAISGLPTNRFVFEGFLPTKARELKERLSDLSNEERTIILYEAPHRLLRTLENLSLALGSDRETAIVRELTKVHEEVQRGSLNELIAFNHLQELRGEYVIVLHGCTKLEPQEASPTMALLLYDELVGQGLSRANALKEAARRTGLTRDDIYILLSDRKTKEELN